MSPRKSYLSISQYCKNNAELSAEAIDKFLLYYAAARENINPQLKEIRRTFRHMVPDIEEKYFRFLEAEFIAHRIFRKDGYIKKYLNHSEVKKLPADQYKFLQLISERPWRYSVAAIEDSPADNFFEMADINGENYLLYSPGVQKTLSDHNPQLWLALIAFNGECWETFGLIIPFVGFNVDDLLYFGGEVNNNVYDEDGLLEEMEKNPFPFFMLLAFSVSPIIVGKGKQEIRYNVSKDGVEWTVPSKLKDFKIEWNKDVYKLSLKKFEEMPDSAIAYYDEDKKIFLRSAMTEKGFEALTEALVNVRPGLDTVSDISVSIAMERAAEKILQRPMNINPYASLFDSGEDSPEIHGINRFLALALPLDKAGEQLNIAELAKEAGIDPIIAADLWKKVKQRIARLKKGR